MRSQLHVSEKAKKGSTSQPLLAHALSSHPEFDEFCFDLSEAFVAANIPWRKLDHPTLRRCLEKYTHRKLPAESTLRKNYLPILYEKVLDEIRASVAKGPMWAAADETTDVCGRYVAHLIVGRLGDDKSSRSYLLACRVLEKTNYSTVARFVNDSLKTLWPDGGGEDFRIFYTDAAAYMIKAADSLKVFYPNLVHVTCLAHGINRVAEEVRNQYPLTNKMVSVVKKIFVKAPSRREIYRALMPDVPLPPEPVVTRWGTWLEAVNFYADHFDSLKDVVSRFNPEDSSAVREAQTLFEDPLLAVEVQLIKTNFTFLARSIRKLETGGLPLLESLDVVNQVGEELAKITSPVGRHVSRKFEAVLQKNPGYSTLKAVGNVMASAPNATLPENVPAGLLPAYKYAPLTTCDVERSFSNYKNILSDRRQKFTEENIERYIVSNVFYNGFSP